jgi:hypothetical protein
MKLSQFTDYRYADAVLNDRRFSSIKKEVIEILERIRVPMLDPARCKAGKVSGAVKRRKRSPIRGSNQDRYFFLPVDQIKLNSEIDAQFGQRGWEVHPLVVPAEQGIQTPGLRSDFKKDRVQVEVQFGNMARWYTDVFKFQLAYARSGIDVAILIVATQMFANLIDENVAYWERVNRELPSAKMSLTLPIWVIGIEPDNFEPFKHAYDKAFEVLRAEPGYQNIAKIPYEDRIQEEASQDPDETGK